MPKGSAKYRIALCKTKPTDRGELLIQSFMRGIEKNNDSYLIVDGYNQRHIEMLKRCDVLFQICDYNSKVGGGNKENNFRKWCRDNTKLTHSNRRLILDVGFFKNHSDTPDIKLEDAMWSIGYDGIKAEANFYNENSPPDRWNSFGIELKSWRIDGDYILVLGQNETGISTQHINYEQWMNETIVTLKTLTDRPIKLMAHRHQTKFPQDKSVEVIKGRSIYENCDKAWAVVARTTNGAAGAIISGIPVFTEDRNCIAYPVSNHCLEDINNPKTFDRAAWCNDIGYSQWSIREIKRGECWSHLRKHLYEEDKKEIVT